MVPASATQLQAPHGSGEQWGGGQSSQVVEGQETSWVQQGLVSRWGQVSPQARAVCTPRVQLGPAHLWPAPGSPARWQDSGTGKASRRGSDVPVDMTGGRAASLAEPTVGCLEGPRSPCACPFLLLPEVEARPALQKRQSGPLGQPWASSQEPGF